MEPGVAVIPSQFTKPRTRPDQFTKPRTRPVVNKTHLGVLMGGFMEPQPTEPVTELVADFDTGVLQIPDGRAGLARWTEYALRVGFTQDEIANLNKNEIRALVGPR
jgi:hypothetical protein